MIKSVKPIMMEEDHGLLTPGCVVEMSEKIYVLISEGWDHIDNGHCERCLGVFSSSAKAVEAANDYLKKISNNSDVMGDEVYNVDGLILPTNPLTFDMLDINGEKCEEGYEYLNNNNMYGASLYIDTYDLNKCYF